MEEDFQELRQRVWNLPRGKPKLLAGPIVRRCDAREICLWMATNHAGSVWGRVYEISGNNQPGRLLGEVSVDFTQLGEFLYIALIQVPAASGSLFPTGIPLGYALEFTFGDGKLVPLNNLCANGLRDLLYKPYSLPTVLLGPTTRPTFAHASCRKFHGEGYDAMGRLDHELEECIARRPTGEPDEPPLRPTALFLTGDQIYADDVPEPLIDTVIILAHSLMGFDELLPVDTRHTDEARYYKATSVRCGFRAQLLQRSRGEKFTSGLNAGRNQLLALGEFAAAYILAWNEACWPDRLPAHPPCQKKASQDNAAFDKSVDAPTPYDQQLIRVEIYRREVSAVRRVLANIPTYMMLDDHEVTDDWNISGEWADLVRQDPLAARVVGNALTAFWCFQGVGNFPSKFAFGKRAGLVEYLQSLSQAVPPKRSHPTDRQNWTFVAPTSPPVLVLDTRTQRAYGRGNRRRSPPALLSSDAFSVARRLLHEIGAATPGRPIIVVSPPPVFGPHNVEAIQSYVRLAVQSANFGATRYFLDPEAWSANLPAMGELLSSLHEFGAGSCIFLSGDVHYGCVMEGLYAERGKRTHFIQFTSSGARNSAPLLPYYQYLERTQPFVFEFSFSPKVAPVSPPDGAVNIHFPGFIARELFDRNVGILELRPGHLTVCRFLTYDSHGGRGEQTIAVPRHI